MENFEVDMKGINDFRGNLDLIQRYFPREAKQMLQRIGNKAAVIVRKKSRQLLRRGEKDTYYRAIKRGKVWKKIDGTYVIRVYSKDPKQFLIEYGHRLVDKDGKEHGFVEGRYVFEKGIQEMNSQFEDILLTEFDKFMDKL